MKVAGRAHTPSPSLLCFLRRQLESQTCGNASAILPSRHTPWCQQGRALTSLSHPSTSRGPRFTNHDRQRLATRHFCTTTPLRDNFWRKLRPASRKNGGRSLGQDDLPPLQGFLDDDAGLGGRIIKPSSELKLRCTEFDENGNVTLVNGEFRKSELIAKVRCVVVNADSIV